jgi:hypothetical protein
MKLLVLYILGADVERGTQRRRSLLSWSYRAKRDCRDWMLNQHLPRLN